MKIDVSKLIKVSSYAKLAKSQDGSVGISRTEAYKRIKGNKVGTIRIDGILFIDRRTI